MVSGHQRLALQSWPVKLFTEPHYIYVSEADVCLKSHLSGRPESVNFFMKPE